jgi:hypothetical protein
MILCETCERAKKGLVRIGPMQVPRARESRTLYAEIAAKIGLRHIHVLNFHIDIVNLAI